MEADKKFKSKDELEEWLKARGVDKEDVEEAAEKLFAKGFNKPSTLIGISSDNLIKVGFSIPVAQHLSNKLEKQEVAVRTQFLENVRQGTDEDFENEVLMKKVAKAVAYLGRNKLLYTDLRPQNILVEGSDKVWLIDYDDIRIQENVLTVAANFASALSEEVDGLPVIPCENNYIMENNELFSTFIVCLGQELSPAVDLAQLSIGDGAPS